MKEVLRDVVVEVDGTDLSDHFTQVTVEDSANEVDSTAFGSVYTQAMKGMRTCQITGTVQQDFAAASVHSVLNDLNNQDTPFEVLVTPRSAAVSATNPQFRLAESQLLGYMPLSGGVGDLSTTDVTFTNAGDTGIEVLTA
ncbi:MAG: hypothetical protein EHM90_00410 [Chloroflexi bacterium]|nr:MAG: hypothetical protein EHM90_00410 [Chloroflexota bacterium]